MSATRNMSGSARGPLRHTKSESYFRKASKVIAGGVNSNVRMSGWPTPLCFKSAKGALLTDVDGNEYVDYAAGMGPVLLGHANPALVNAVAKSLELGQLYAGQSELELQLVERLHSLIPCADLVRLGMSGSEMVQAAVRVSRSYTNRMRCIKFEGHYHGWFDNILLNLSSEPEAPPPGTPIKAKLESRGQSPSVLDDIVILPWNDIDALRIYLESHGNEVACILMEPVMCNVGVIPPLPGFLEAVRELCDYYSIVFIMDEVITGFRLDIRGAQGLFGITPDIATYAKALGGGFPIAAMAGRESIMAQIGSGAVNHSGTYNANLISLAAGIATIDTLKSNGGAIYTQINSIGQTLIEGIREIGRESGRPLRVQGYSSVFFTYFSDNEPVSSYAQVRSCDRAKQQEFLRLLQETGIRPTARGTWFMTAAHDDALVSRTLEAVRYAIHKLD